MVWVRLTDNRLIAAQDYQLDNNRVDRALTTLEYDGDGRRLVQAYDPKICCGGDKRTEYVFDGLDPVAEYALLNGQRDDFYRGAMGRISAMHHFPAGTPGQMYWYHYNFKGDVAGLTKQDGQSTHNYRYDPYGGVIPDSGNFTDPHNHYTLTGKKYDDNTGLVYFGVRDYDPSVGAWLTQNTFRGTVFLPKSLHRYEYVYGNPISYYDQYGYWPDFLDKAAETVGNFSESAKNFVVEHKTEFALGAAVVGATVLTVAIAGAASPLLVAAVGAGSAAITTVKINQLDSRANWYDDVVKNTIGGAAIGLGIGGVGSAARFIPQILASSLPLIPKITATGKALSLATTYVGLSIWIYPFFSEKTRERGLGISSLGLLSYEGFDYAGQLACNLNPNRTLKGRIPDQPPATLAQQLALEEAKAGSGNIIMKNLADTPRLESLYEPGKWVKLEHVHRSLDGTNIVIHWFRNLTTGQNVEYKFKL